MRDRVYLKDKGGDTQIERKRKNDSEKERQPEKELELETYKV